MIEVANKSQDVATAKCCFVFTVPTAVKILVVLTVLAVVGAVMNILRAFSYFGSAIIMAIIWIVG